MMKSLFGTIEWRARFLGGFARALLAMALAAPLSSHAVLTITPITWDVIGLDSNDVNTGPDTFPVGARVCNTGPTAASSVTATFNATSINPFISLQGASSLSIPSLPVGAAPPSQYTINSTPANCYDFYFNLKVSRSSLVYNTTLGYRIDATASGFATVSTPTPRQLYVEKLISQNRNSVTSFTGPTSVVVGQTYQYSLSAKTATGGYEQIENFPTFPNSIFQILSVSTSYSQPAGAVNSTVYGDACGWQNNPIAIATYRSCVGPANYAGGKAGDNVTTTYTVRIISASSTTVNNLIYDFSGSSYHYNSDYGSGGLTVTATPPAAPGISKSFNSSSISPGGVSVLTITLSNSNSGALAGAAFTDTYAAGMTNTATPGATTTCPGGTVTAANNGNSVSLANATIPASGSCTVTVNVTAAAAGSYTNTIPAGGLTTTYAGSNASLASATLTVAAPSLVNLKTVAVTSDPVNGATNPKFIPGAEALYTIRITNQGAGTVDNNTVVIVDPIPANTELFVNDLGGAGSGPIVFVDGAPSSALTWTFTSLASTTDDVEFSNNGGATYAYTPAPNAQGYDPAVTHIRLKPKGTMAANTGLGSPSFDLRFRVRVK